jgi:hypothetical protein
MSNLRSVNVTPGPLYVPPAVYTPVCTGFGTLAASNVWSVRIGSMLFVHGTITAGTVTTTEARVGLPGILTSSANYSTIEVAGTWASADEGTTAMGCNVLIEASKGYVTFGRQGATHNGIAKRNADDMFTNGGIVRFQFTVMLD